MNVVTKATAVVGFSNARFLVVGSKFRDLAHGALDYLHMREIKYAADAGEAIAMLKRCGEQINGVICDWDTAPVGGFELVRMIRSQNFDNVSPSLCVVILTTEANAAVMRAAKMLDVNGVVVAPQSKDQVAQTLCDARHRSWMLKTPEHYLAVTVVEPPSAEGPHAVSLDDEKIWRRDADTTVDLGPNRVGSPAPRPYFNSALLTKYPHVHLADAWGFMQKAASRWNS